MSLNIYRKVAASQPNETLQQQNLHLEMNRVVQVSVCLCDRHTGSKPDR